MSSFNFDYEIKFTNVFDASLINVPDKNDTLVSLIQAEFNKLSSVMSLHSGINLMTTFLEYNSKNYKITFEKL